jgi:hypothetical protein
MKLYRNHTLVNYLMKRFLSSDNLLIFFWLNITKPSRVVNTGVQKGLTLFRQVRYERKCECNRVEAKIVITPLSALPKNAMGGDNPILFFQYDCAPL